MHYWSSKLITVLKEERMRKKQERIQFLEILEQPEKQEHPELTSSEQEQGDASAVSVSVTIFLTSCIFPVFR